MISTNPDWKHRAMHLGALWGLAIGKPLLDATNESGFFFIPRSAAPVDIVLIAILVLFAMPALLLAIEQLVGLASAKARDGLHLAFVALLLGVLVIQIMPSLGVRDPSRSVPLSALIALIGALAYARTKFLPTTLDVLSPAPVLFLVLFLFFSPSTGLWLPGSDPEASDAAPSAGDGPPVVMIVLDEFPTSSLLDEKGRIDASLFPNFARLAKRSTWYENATSVGDQTEHAVPAILTGMMPADEGKPVPTARAHPESLFTLLGGSYEIDGIETVTQVCPRDICEREIRDPFPERFARIAGDLARYTPAAVLPARVHKRIFGIGSDISPLPPLEPPDLFDLLLDDINPGAGRLEFLHAADLPHKPWVLTPDGRSYEDPAERDEIFEAPLRPPALSAEVDARKRHLLQVGAADKLVGEVIQKLDELGTWDETMLVVTADHGISFRDGTGRRRANERNLDQIAMVPVFVKLPGQVKGGPDPRPLWTIDLVPTIAEAVGVEIPWEVDGIPAGRRSDPVAEMINFRGDKLRVDLAKLRAMQREFGAVWRQRLTTGKGWEALIRSGPATELLDKPVPADLPDAEGSATITGLDPQDGDLPVVIAGRLKGVEVTTKLALAVDGKIVATSVAIGTKSGERYEAVLPPSVYENPIGSVQLLLVNRRGGFELLASADG